MKKFYLLGANPIKSITAINFQNLKTMKHLNLFKAEIEVIPENAFEDLVSLEILFLGKKHFQGFFKVFYYCSNAFRRQSNPKCLS